MYWKVFRKSVRRSDRQASTPGCSTRPLIIRNSSQWLRWDVGPTASLVLSQGGLPVAYRATVPRRESNPQTFGFQPSRSADVWRTWAKWSRTELNHRFLGVDQVSLPLDHGTVFLKWSHRESHPDLQHAMLASSCWTMTPKRKRKPCGLEPTSGKSAAACLPSRFLTSSDDFRNQSHPSGSRPTPTMRSVELISMIARPQSYGMFSYWMLVVFLSCQEVRLYGGRGICGSNSVISERSTRSPKLRGFLVSIRGGQFSRGRAHSSYRTHQFDDVEGGHRPTPFRFHFFQSCAVRTAAAPSPISRSQRWSPQSADVGCKVGGLTRSPSAWPSARELLHSHRG